MKKNLLALSLLGGVVFAQDNPIDPCGSPNEVLSKYLLDQCYKGYFQATTEAKKNADEALRLATEANKKLNDLEKRLSFFEKPADDEAIMEAKKNAEEALRLATEANNKLNELEERLSSFEKPADDEAIMEAKKNADEALRLATEANNKVGDLENRVSSLEKTADDHERRIRDLEGRKPEAPQPKSEGVGPYKWQLEEIGVVYFDFNKFNIKESEAKKLDELVGKIRESGREVLVVGFADKRGASNYNFNLSMWRAQMTASYLAKKGVDIGKIRVAAYGKEVADLLGRDFKTQRAVKIYIIY